MKFYFVLQWRRLLRSFHALGIMPFFAIVPGVLGFLLASVALFRRMPVYAVYVYPVFAIAGCFLLNEKEKIDFLRTVFSRNSLLAVRAVENALIALPFVLFIACRHEWLMSALTLAFCIVLSPARWKRTGILHFPTPFSRRPYEFSTGFRRNILLLLALYAISFIALGSHNYNLGIVLVLALSLTASTFYSHLDPVFYVWIFALTARNFLFEKIRTGVLQGIILMAPVILPLLAIYPARIPLTLLVALIGVLIAVLAVLAAYVNFPAKMTLMQQIKFYAGVFFPPALLIIIPDFYLKASERLKWILKC